MLDSFHQITTLHLLYTPIVLQVTKDKERENDEVKKDLQTCNQGFDLLDLSLAVPQCKLKPFELDCQRCIACKLQVQSAVDIAHN